jgi:DNA mismatch endonuclease (patch repair protein)
MPDVFTKAKRSEVMSRIRGRGNKDTELALAMLMRRHRISGWRRHVEIRGRAVLPRGPNFKAAQQRRPTLPKHSAHGVTRPTFRVRPDFIFPKLKLALFVDGCFWHGCPKHCNQPANNRAFWQRKLAGNVARDRLVIRTLRRAGWRVLRVWEHELVRKNEARLLQRLRSALL